MAKVNNKLKSLPLENLPIGTTVFTQTGEKSVQVAQANNVNNVVSGISDGLHYVDDCTDIAYYKDVFRLIFEALQQEQHYNMMMCENE